MGLCIVTRLNGSHSAREEHDLDRFGLLNRVIPYVLCAVVCIAQDVESYNDAMSR